MYLNLHSARKRDRENSTSMASKFDSNENSTRHFKNLIMDQIGEIQMQKVNKKELIDQITELNGWVTADQKKSHLKNINDRVNELKNLGEYGVRFEELRIGIEKRYEFMMSDVETKLKSIKEHFVKLIEDSISEFSNNILFHKTQNLANLKDLEKELNNLKVKEKKKPPKGIVFDIYTDDSLDRYFSFMSNFKEEFFGLILSKCIMKNIEEMKDVLIKFKTQYLVDLVQAPKKFPSELFTYFEKESLRKYIPPSKKVGRVLAGIKPAGDVYGELQKANIEIQSGLSNGKKCPILIPITKSIFAVACKDQYKLYVDQNSESQPKSSFFKNSPALGASSKGVVEIASGKLSPSEENMIPDICCGIYLKTENHREYLMLGGDYNVGLAL